MPNWGVRRQIIEKKMKALKYLSILVMGLAGAILVSCGDDEDEIESGGSSSSSGSASAVIVDGVTTAMSYGFYDTQESGFLNMEFSNVNIKDPSGSMPAKMDVVTLTMRHDAKEIQEGNYKAGMEYWSMSPQSGSYYATGSGEVSVTIKKNGTNYSVTIPETEINLYQEGNESKVKKSKFKFNYNGNLVYFTDF